MKKKYSRILGVALTLVLLASFFGFATPVSAANVGWSGVVNPGNTLVTGLNIADGDVGPIAVTPDGGTIFAAVECETNITSVGFTTLPVAGFPIPWALLQSTDGGHNWAATGLRMNAGPITGIAISSNFATDGTMYVAAWSGTLGTPAVFRTQNSGRTFTELKAVPNEANGAATTVINSVDMWPASPYAYVMVGTDTDVWVLQDAPFGIWKDQEVNALGPVNITAVAFAPDFDTTNYIWAVTAAGVVTTTNSPGAWGTILGNTLPLAAVVSADIGFAGDYNSMTTPYLWVGLNGAGLNPAGAGVYRVRGLPGASQAIQQLPATDIRSIAVSGSMATATILAGQENSARISKSVDGGVMWISPVLKQPTGGGVTYVVMAPDFATATEKKAYVGTSDFATITPTFSASPSTATWVTATTITPASGTNSAELVYDATTNNAYVEFIPRQRLAMSDLATIGATDFLYHMLIQTSGGANMELRFTSAGFATTTFGHADVNVQVVPGFTAGVWATEDAVANPQVYTYFNDPVNNIGSVVGLSPGPFFSLATTLAAIDADPVMTAVGASAADWLLTRVRIEIGWGGPTRTCYIDDVTIDGVTYQMEPSQADSSAFQVSGNAGMSFNQTGLIDTTFTAINDVAVVSLDTIFMVSNTSDLWKTEDATATKPVWERILTPATVTVPGNALTATTINFVATSPDFLTDGVVYAANTATGIMKSISGGDIFAPMGPPGAAITALHVVNATFAFTGAIGRFYRTDDGAYSWLAAVTPPGGTIVSIATSPDYATDGTLLVGNTVGEVYRSINRGITFAQVGGTGATIAAGVTNTYVAFDPGYATNNVVYAGGNAVIARFNFFAPTAPWATIDGTATMPMPTVAPTVAVADAFQFDDNVVGDSGTITVITGSVTLAPQGTATVAGAVMFPNTLTITAGPVNWTTPAGTGADTIIVTAASANSAGTWTSTITATKQTISTLPSPVDPDNDVSLTGSGTGSGAWNLPDVAGVGALTASTINGLVTSPDGTLYGSNALTGQGMERSLNPTAALTAPVEGARAPVFERATSALAARATFNGLWLVVDDTLDVVGSKNVFFSIDTTGVGGIGRIMTYTDTLATPIVLTGPEDGAIFARETAVTLEWERLTGALSYRWEIATDALFFLPVDSGFSGYPTDTSILLGAGRTYYWRVRVDGTPAGAPGLPVLSRWSEARTFTTLLGARPWHPFTNIGGVAPGPGASDVLTKPTFQWNGADWATSYQLMLADNAAFTGATTKTLTTTSWVCDTDLGYSTTWYWKVIALSATSESEWSDVGVFTTMAEPVEALPPVVIQDVPDIVVEQPDIVIPAAVEATPTWALLVIIIVGAVLVVSVIVLIVRTRRPI